MSKVVFLHLPKTGGTSLHNLLSQNFHDHEICPERFNQLHKYSREELDKYAFFSGHYDYQSLSLIPGEKKIVTILREPRSRILSLYYFWRAHTEDHIKKHKLTGPRIAREFPLEDFLVQKDSGIPQNFDNAMTRNLIGGAVLYNNDSIDEISTKALVSQALGNLENMNAFGIMEEMEISIKHLTESLDLPWEGIVPHDNAAKNFDQVGYLEKIEKEPLTQYAEEKIVSLTRVDSLIYEEIKNNFLSKH